MAKKVSLEPVFNTARQRWCVDVPASKSSHGKRIRAFFKTRQAARDYIDRIDGPTPAAVIDPRLANDAETARQRIEVAGLDMTLAEVAAGYIEAVQTLAGSGSLLEAARTFRQQQDARTSSRLMGEAVAAFMDSKDGTLRPRTEQSYRYTLEKTLAPLHEKTLADINTEALADILGSKRATSRALHVRNLRVFWTWACKKPRAWATMDVVDALEYRKDADDGDIVVLRPDDVRALLLAAESWSANAAVAFALSIFAGVRQAELERLTWRHVLSDHIDIGANVAKKGKRRLIPISPTLRAWLDTYTPDNADKEDFIVGPNWTATSCAVRRLAGWDVAARLLDNPPAAARGKWPANAPRHTCASVLAATGEPLETLIFQFGHSGGHDLLRRHYVGRLTKKEALAILSVGPKGRKIPVMTAA